MGLSRLGLGLGLGPRLGLGLAVLVLVSVLVQPVVELLRSAVCLPVRLLGRSESRRALHRSSRLSMSRVGPT